MAHTLLALYNHPEDPEAFDRHYAATHAQLGLAFPGLRSFTGVHPGPQADGSPPPYYFVAILTFDSAEAMGQALSGPEGTAAVDDLANFAGAGVTLVNGPLTTYL